MLWLSRSHAIKSTDHLAINTLSKGFGWGDL